MTMMIESKGAAWVSLGEFPDLDLDALLDNLDPHELLPVLLQQGAPPVGTVDEILLDAHELLARITPVGRPPAPSHYELAVRLGPDPETGEDIGPELQAIHLVPALQERQDGPLRCPDEQEAASAARARLDPAVAALLGIFPFMSPAEAQRRLDETERYLAETQTHEENAMPNPATSLPTAEQMQLARREAQRTGRPYQDCLTAVRLQATREVFQRSHSLSPAAPRVQASAPRQSAPVTATKHAATMNEARVQLSSAMPGFSKLGIDAQQHAARTFLAKGKVDLDCYPGATKRVRANAYLAATTAGWDKLTRDQQWGLVKRLVGEQVPA